MTDRRSFLRGASVLMGHAAFGQVMTAFAAAPRKATFFTDSEMRHAARAGGRDPAGHGFARRIRRRYSLLHRSGHSRLRQRRGAEDLSRRPEGSRPEEIRDASRRPNRWRCSRRAPRRTCALPYDQSFFKILKDYTLTGYFLSEIGATQALAYERVPGGFQGDLPLAANQKAWAI